MPDFDFEDERPARRRRREAGHGSSGFWTMFGGSMGCFAAAVFVCFLMCAGCVGLVVMSQKDKPAATQPDK